ncbi:hypothetical protein M427DRAFT_60243 [Gonapodya prolifera JEL478]|uniref:PARP-type domain-containing protein n=1 Tax=Gonapodya prolifera (strain JEL478) TaxID=1344416 RepID=A0A139A591_GONPJ|nr:hypothetical protein M427DRAFT_60243 [Gonapodya prolifera JEL478]|eukprot:KXS11789.1 hypothetical protein M427DRAFT_60243 [Gonapodya prolifera JEL478]
MGAHDDEKHIVEYAPTSMSRCRGPKSCRNRTIAEGSLRLGGPKRFFRMYDREGREYRHWDCVTSLLLRNMALSRLVGLKKLTPEDQERVRKAILSGANEADEAQAPANADDDNAGPQSDTEREPPPASAQWKKKRKKVGSDGDDDDDDWKAKSKKTKAKKSKK